MSASNAQSVPVIEVDSSSRRKSKQQSSVTDLTNSEHEEGALRQLGDGLVEYVRENKKICRESNLTSRRGEVETRMHDLSRSIRVNQLSLIRCQDSSEKELLDSFISKDKLELSKKQLELEDIVSKLNLPEE